METGQCHRPVPLIRFMKDDEEDGNDDDCNDEDIWQTNKCHI